MLFDEVTYNPIAFDVVTFVLLTFDDIKVVEMIFDDMTYYLMAFHGMTFVCHLKLWHLFCLHFNICCERTKSWVPCCK